MNAGKKSRSSSSHVYSDEDDGEDEDKDMEAVTCFTGIFPMQQAIKAKGKISVHQFVDIEYR